MSAIAFALFLIGLGGSATHCVGMCGPFVVAQAGPRAEEGNRVLARLRGASLLRHQLGRATTYAPTGTGQAVVTARPDAVATFRVHVAAPRGRGDSVPVTFRVEGQARGASASQVTSFVSPRG
ncbi:MAG: hypothetical protein FJX21_21000 [Alphaproteobacteria bacterium]|nr:hypothetical protein [Alphaproteobacteria bacterium]